MRTGCTSSISADMPRAPGRTADWRTCQPETVRLWEARPHCVFLRLLYDLLAVRVACWYCVKSSPPNGAAARDAAAGACGRPCRARPRRGRPGSGRLCGPPAARAGAGAGGPEEGPPRAAPAFLCSQGRERGNRGTQVQAKPVSSAVRFLAISAPAMLTAASCGAGTIETAVTSSTVTAVVVVVHTYIHT